MDQSSMSPPNTTASSTPSTAAAPGGSILSDLLRTLGVGQSHATEAHNQVQSGDVHQQIDAAHQYVSDALKHARENAQKNPAAVLGGLSALVIAAGMLRNHLGGK